MNDKARANRELQDQWERGIERAAQEREQSQSLDPEVLKNAAGLQVQAGVKAGAWTRTFSCNGSCPDIC
jgi:hypothetical protein